MNRIKGLRDIKTHSTLAHEGLLVGVARNLHMARSRESESENVSDGWSVKRHIFPKKKSASRPTSMASLHRELFLERKTRLFQIEAIKELLEEMRQALDEGIPGAAREFERLSNKLARLEAG